MKTLLAFLCLIAGLLPVFGGVPLRPNQLPPEAITALQTGDKFILFSLEPANYGNPAAPALKTDENHHGFQSLGSLEVKDKSSRSVALATIGEAIRGYDGLAAACFEPRHSLRVITAQGVTYDFVICFACASLRVYRGDESIGGVGITGPQKRLDDLLRSAGIPLAKPRH